MGFVSVNKSIAKFKVSVWITAISALVISAITPLAASATVASTFATNPPTSTSLSLDATVDMKSTFGLPTNSTLDASMQQVWSEGQGLLGAVTSPTGWALEYRVGQSWQSSIPADRLEVSGVRASATALQTGPGTANGTQAVASRTSTVIVADASSISASGRGDGWDVFLSPQYILNVYHHDANYRLECHLRATGALCDSNAVYQVNGYATSNGSGGTYYRGKVYSAVTRSGNAEIICTNVASLPFTSCGSTVIGSGSIAAQNHLGTQVFDGQRVWVGNGAGANLLCFDVTTGAACTAVSLSGYANSGSAIKSFSTFIDGKIFVNANKLFCIEPTTGATCSGAWPVAVASTSGQSNVIPKRTTAGVINGVCTITVDRICFDLAGASVAMPSALNTMLTTNASAVHGGYSYFQTTAWTTTRQYWAANPTGADWTSGYAQCYDWAAESACSGFATNVSLGLSRYAFTIDSANTNCVWTNGDSGTISNFDGNTGAAGCPVTTTKASLAYDSLPRFSCNVNTSTIRSFQQLQVIMPSGSTFSTSNLKVTVVDGQGVAVSGFQNLAVVAGYADLTGLQTSSTTTEFGFIIESVNSANFPLTTQDATAMIGNLIYEADPVQLCVQISSVMPVCPATLSAATYLQPDLVVTSTSSYTIQGSAAVVAEETKTFHVDPITKEQCYVWDTFLNTVGGQGVDTGGLGGLVDSIVFGPDHKMYVGGVFTNAGSNDAADNLAVWDGTSWAPVGKVPLLSGGTAVLDGQGNPTYAPAVNGRVNSIAFTTNGKLLIGGAFTNAGSVDTADYFAIYDLVTNTWSAPTTSLSGAVNTIAISSGGIAYLGGTFTDKVTSLNIATGAWVTMPSLSAEVLKLAISPTGDLYAGGSFSGLFKKFDSVSSSWIDVSADVNQANFLSGAVTDFAFNDGKLYVVGLFNGVAVLDLTADTWSWLGGAANPAGHSRAIAIDAAGNIYVGGYFTTANSVAAINVAMWDGLIWHGFRDSRTLSMAMDATAAAGQRGTWDVTLSPNGVAIWGGDMVNCATRSALDYICYFGDKIVLSPTSLTRNTSPVAPTPYSGPQVVWQSTYSENVIGGTQLLLKGRLLAKTSKIRIGGKDAQILSVSNGEVLLVMPANPVGRQTLELSFSDGSYSFEGYVKYNSASVVAKPVSRPPVTKTISGFADGSPVLTSAIKAKISAFLKAYPDYKNISCVGYTEGPTVLKSDYALSRNRAKNSCSFAKLGLAKNMILAPLKSGQNLKEANAVRRVVITLTD